MATSERSFCRRVSAPRPIRGALLLLLIIMMTLPELAAAKPVAVQKPVPFVADVGDTWGVQYHGDGTVEFDGLLFWQMFATLASYPGTPDQFISGETGLGPSFNLGGSISFSQSAPWTNDGNVYRTWYRSGSPSFDLLVAITPIPGAQPPGVAGFMLGGAPGDIDQDYLRIVSNVMSSVRPYERPPTGLDTEWSRRLAGKAFRITFSDSSGDSTRIQYWFCTDGTYKKVIQRPASGFFTREPGKFRARQSQLELFPAAEAEKRTFSLAFDSPTTGRITLGGSEYQPMENNECP